MSEVVFLFISKINQDVIYRTWVFFESEKRGDFGSLPTCWWDDKIQWFPRTRIQDLYSVYTFTSHVFISLHRWLLACTCICVSFFLYESVFLVFAKAFDSLDRNELWSLVMN